MSKAIICDRCKKMFPERPEGHVYIRIGIDSPFPINPCFPSNEPTTAFKGTEKYDLCPECAIAYSRFINMEGISDAEEN